MNAYWSHFFSCHKCTDPSSIPVAMVLVESSIDPQILGYAKINKDTTKNSKLEAATNATDSASHNASLTCVDVSNKTSFRTSMGLSTDV